MTITGSSVYVADIAKRMWQSTKMKLGTNFQVRVVTSLADIAAPSWDRCANSNGQPYNPFVSHAFLNALEESSCVGGDTGWLPQHLVLQGIGKTGVAGCMPLYLKTHSYGEFVFDHAFADAYMRAGGDYYPKLQCAVPFTPVPGPRLLVPSGPDQADQERALAVAAIELAKRLELSSVHITFLDAQCSARLEGTGYLQRIDQQFHWRNEGYATFDEFLQSLSSRKRKTIRRERREATASGMQIEHLQGDEITEAHWDRFFQFYLDTNERKWGEAYLNRAFFTQLGRTMSDKCLLVMARDDGQYVAGALHIVGGDCLYGRYWGAREAHAFLHFELCYYQAIDYAITHNLGRVEAGAQGSHKLTRGYLPTPTYSAHWFRDERLADAVSDYLEHERAQVSYQRKHLARFAPFKKCD